MMSDLKNAARTALERCAGEDVHDWASLKSSVKKDVSNLIYSKTKRSPMILPIITEV